MASASFLMVRPHGSGQCPILDAASLDGRLLRNPSLDVLIFCTRFAIIYTAHSITYVKNLIVLVPRLSRLFIVIYKRESVYQRVNRREEEHASEGVPTATKRISTKRFPSRQGNQIAYDVPRFDARFVSSYPHPRKRKRERERERERERKERCESDSACLFAYAFWEHVWK
ncbi:hypothetical protein PUN28_002791 [Cardiocondyla obscurior]|uniref:Uncharacterized protein n=1 Tax=Cardiocondyla obscurior TaxID=286306 RepID=A0AAW2GWE7_9HYME